MSNRWGKPRKSKKRIDPRYFLEEQGRLDEAIDDPKILKRLDGVIRAFLGVAEAMLSRGLLSTPEVRKDPQGREIEPPPPEPGPAGYPSTRTARPAAQAVEAKLAAYTEALRGASEALSPSHEWAEYGKRRSNGTPARGHIANPDRPQCLEDDAHGREYVPQGILVGTGLRSATLCSLLRGAIGYLEWMSWDEKSVEAVELSNLPGAAQGNLFDDTRELMGILNDKFQNTFEGNGE